MVTGLNLKWRNRYLLPDASWVYNTKSLPTITFCFPSSPQFSTQSVTRDIKNLIQVMGWIQEKHQVASDESYRDPVNLSGKIQKHQAFEAELSANKRRVDSVDAEGSELIERQHFASRDIEDKQEMLEKAWQELVEASQEKSVRLNQAYQVSNGDVRSVKYRCNKIKTV